MNKAAIKKVPRRLAKAGDYHVLQVRFEPLAWQLVKQTAKSKGKSASRLVSEMTVATLSVTHDPETKKPLCW